MQRALSDSNRYALTAHNSSDMIRHHLVWYWYLTMRHRYLCRPPRGNILTVTRDHSGALINLTQLANWHLRTKMRLVVCILRKRYHNGIHHRSGLPLRLQRDADWMPYLERLILAVRRR